jgi:hypothetical protein
MRAPPHRLAFAALLAVTLFLAACGGSGDGVERYTGCFDHDGFPVPCDSLPNKHGPAYLEFAPSVNRAGVHDGSDQLVTFHARAPHAAQLLGATVGDLVLDPSGRLFWRGLPAGWVCYARGAEGGTITVLVDDAGRMLDLEVTPDGATLRSTAEPAPLLVDGGVPPAPEVRALTTLPVAAPAAAR